MWIKDYGKKKLIFHCSRSVIVNGLVEVVKPNGERVEYKLGDSFGAEPNPAVQYHVGEMRTMVDDCEFVLVEHKDFCSIMSTIGEHIEKDRDGLTGEIVSETERRTVGSQVGLVLIKGKPDKLIQHLVDDRDSNVDPHYVDDFLLTYRVFIHNPTIIFEKLMMWFADSALRDKIARIVLLWVNNHYNDFETNDEMTKLLERFEGALERDGMHSQQSLLNIACSVKARSRTVVYARANKDDALHFTVQGGKECGCGIFISEVQVDSPAELCGMKRGDEVLDVNGQPMKYLTLAKAQEIMKGSISLTITLKSNVLGFKELLGKTERDGSKVSSKNRALAGVLAQARGSMPNVIPVKSAKAVKIGGKTSMMDKLMTILKSSKEGEDVPDEARTTTNPLRPSRSNPDITSISQYYGPVKSECPEHVLKIYRSDQTFKYLAVYKETTAQNVVQLALQDDALHFSVQGGKECGCGIFISEVQVDSPAELCGMKRGDEVLDVNGQPMKYLTLAKAQEIMKGSISLTITLKSNVLGFKELLGKTERDGSKVSSKNRALAGVLAQARGSMPNVIPVKSAKAVKIGDVVKTSMMDKLMTILKSSKDGEDIPDEARTTTNPLRSSRSNPDITSISQYYGPVKSECPEHVLKIYRSDQTFKYLAVYKETTAQNVVQLALQEFNMTAEGSLEWSLCECTVTEDGVIKQRRLPPQMENLAERIALNSRYYLKNNNRSDPLVPDDLAPEIMRDAQAQLLSLNAQVVAAQLTLQDFAVFASIEPTEYIDNLFQLESRYGSPRLEEFERIFNREMWWVATEVCSERNVQKRAKLIKKFIKVARHCRELRNFNSMFAIMSGLDKPAVRRLHSTWERISGKYIRMLEDVQQLVDPSRNMSKYRQHLAEVSQEPPVVPIYPVIKKDLTFSHEGNPTYCDKLVNFEKLRLIAKSVRAVSKLSSAPYEISSMAERSGGTISDALLHMNTFEGGNVATMRKGGRVIQPRKKVYEQALMVRKVKAYLDGLKVVDTESELDRLSYDIEPQQAGPRVRRAPSPSPSSVSSQSAESNSTDQRRFRGGVMFGVDSPQAVQKMLGLVQTSKSKDSSAKRPFPTYTKPPSVSVTVVQPSRFAQYAHNRSPYAMERSTRSASLTSTMLSDSMTPYFSLKGSRTLQNYISPSSAMIRKENVGGTIKDG
ncbi:RasGEF domain protein [Ancylostoma duodenale]|uniref:RasGEF domain protein n=1 Tax=Ancylostoma duodenale TaxID=51022 RepID=A0A0C2GDL9_9BILA|nr:RasGEF domain protein [Ancylostoma duodenale]